MTTHLSNFNIKQATNFYLSALKQFEELEKSVEMNTKTASEAELTDVISNGFCDRSNFVNGRQVSIIFDATKDPALSKCVEQSKSLLRGDKQLTQQVSLLCKFVAMKLGGTAQDLHKKYEAAAMEFDGKEILIGHIIGKAGMQRQRSLLFKYLADQVLTEKREKEKKEAFRCRLFKKENSLELRCTVELSEGSKKQLELDLMSNSPGFAKETSPQQENVQAIADTSTDEIHEGSLTGETTHDLDLKNLKLVEQLLHSKGDYTFFRRPFSKTVLSREKRKYNFCDLNPLYFPDHHEHISAKIASFKKIGQVAPSVFLDNEMPLTSLRLIKRTENPFKKPTILLVTDGLSNPSTISDIGFGLEVVAEAESIAGVENNFLRSMLVTISQTIQSQYLEFKKDIRKSIEENGYFRVRIRLVGAPSYYSDPVTKACQVLLWTQSPTLPDYFYVSRKKVLIVAARLLTLHEQRIINRYQTAGTKAIVAQWINEGSHHLSSMQVPSIEEEKKARARIEKIVAVASRGAYVKADAAAKVILKKQEEARKEEDAREKAIAQLGRLDTKMLAPTENSTTPHYYIIHRQFKQERTVLLASKGLSDASEDSPIGCGMEIIAEASAKEVGTDIESGNSFLYQMMHEVAGNCVSFGGTKVRSLLEKHQYISMELNNVEAPSHYVDPKTGRVSVLIGCSSSTIPESFNLPGGEKILWVTVRLLTFAEFLVIRDYQYIGRKVLAEQFRREETDHLSTAVQPSASESKHNELRISMIRAEATKQKYEAMRKDGTLHVYEGPMISKAYFQDFAAPSPLKSGVAAIHALLKLHYKEDNIFAIHSLLNGWMYFDAFRRNPKLYEESKVKALEAAQGPSTVENPTLYGIQIEAEKLIDRLIGIVGNSIKNEGKFSANACLSKLIQEGWIKESEELKIKCESKVTQLLKTFSDQFNSYRDLEKKGVAWPHSPELRAVIESTGFAFRPMLVKRDRCVCDTCGAEVWGWRPWDDPVFKHNLAKHEPNFAEKIKEGKPA